MINFTKDEKLFLKGILSQITVNASNNDAGRIVTLVKNILDKIEVFIIEDTGEKHVFD